MIKSKARTTQQRVLRSNLIKKRTKSSESSERHKVSMALKLACVSLVFAQLFSCPYKTERVLLFSTICLSKQAMTSFSKLNAFAFSATSNVL